MNSNNPNKGDILIYQSEDGELDEISVVRKFLTTASDGKSYETNYYNHDMIISLGYRIRSVVATRFHRLKMPIWNQ